MAEPPPGGPAPSPPPAGDATSDMAGRLGERAGRVAAAAMRRLEQMALSGAAMTEQSLVRQMTAARDVAAQRMPGQPTSSHPEADDGDAGSRASHDPGVRAPDSATARADVMVDGAGAQLGALVTLASHHLRRAASLAREEAEDMWAEAQQIHAARRGEPGGGPGNIS